MNYNNNKKKTIIGFEREYVVFMIYIRSIIILITLLYDNRTWTYV